MVNSVNFCVKFGKLICASGMTKKNTTYRININTAC